MVLSAYLIGNDLIREAKVQSLNDSKLLEENNRLIREKKIKEGEPLTIEKPNLTVQAVTALELLKKYTYAPKKAYSYLFNIDNGVSDFITYHEDFSKLIRGLTNISAEDFITEFKYFQDVEMKKPAFKTRTRFGKTSERKKYEEVERQKKIEAEYKKDFDNTKAARYKDQRDEVVESETIYRDALTEEEEINRNLLEQNEKNDLKRLNDIINEYRNKKNDLMRQYSGALMQMNLDEQTEYSNLLTKISKVLDEAKILKEQIDQIITKRKEIQEINKTLLERNKKPSIKNRDQYERNKRYIISLNNEIAKLTRKISKLSTERSGYGIKPRKIATKVAIKKVKKITLKEPTKKVVYPYGQWFAYR